MTRIGLVQMHCEKDAIRKNAEAIMGYMDEAASRGVHVIGFPEMSLTGYIDPTKYPEAPIELGGPELAELLRLTASNPVAALVGLAERNPKGKPFITQVLIRGGALLGSYRKATIAENEAELFEAGSEAPIFAVDGIPFGIAICADIGNEALFSEYRRRGARIVFELAAPGLYGDQAGRDWGSGYAWWEGECRKRLGRYAKELGLWIAVATQAGRTQDEDFPGGGYLFAPGGERVFATVDWRPSAAYLDLDFKTGAATAL